MTSERDNEAILRGLLDSIREGNEDALTDLLIHYQAFIHGLAHVSMDRGLASKVSASDIAQEALIDAFQSLPEFNGTTAAELRAWLRKLVKHNKIDQDRRYRDTAARQIDREVSLDNAGPVVSRETTGSSYVRRAERDQQLAGVIRELPQRDQQILELRHQLGFGFAQIGERVGLTEASARKQWSRIVTQLGYKLNPEDH